ncbi:MAG: TldD/PmbA family protein [Asticcacaulis sp.]|uniref:TldD/PmbA family protein n=1 Tax=Asticcacaulis sp. TaxID=1872648 RepID=UPI0039E65F5A
MLQSRNAPLTAAPDARFERLENLLTAARKAGADACEAVFAESRSLSVGVRKAAVETVERDENSDLGLRVFVGRKQAVVSVSEFSQGTLDRLVERAIAMAQLAPDDAYAGLADPALLYAGTVTDLQLFDGTHLSAESLQQRALDIEAAGLSLGSDALQSDAASTGYVQNQWSMLTSGGFRGNHTTSLFFQSGRYIATDAEGNMERDGEGRSVRFASDLPDASDTGRIAAERALAALGARKIDTQKTSVIFDKRIAKSLISQFIGAISGTMVARGSSFLKDRLGQRLFDSSIQIIDNPLRVRGLGSCLFDDEGVAVSERHLIKDGVLGGWLLNSAAGRQLGMASTGHASRSLTSAPGVSTHNVTLSAGTQSPESLMASVGQGVIVTSMFGPSVNNDTGDWSAGASGFWFENGVIAYPVNEITVAGNLIDIYSRLVPASDLEIKGTLDTPSLLVEALSVGGK